MPNKLLDESILDPASGSGTFLLNAVRRVLQSKRDGRDHALEYKQIIENNIFGSELMLFPYLISEINILIQFSQELKKIIQKGKKLNVFHVFPNNSFNLITKQLGRKNISSRKTLLNLGKKTEKVLLSKIRKSMRMFS